MKEGCVICFICGKEIAHGPENGMAYMWTGKQEDTHLFEEHKLAKLVRFINGKDVVLYFKVMSREEAMTASGIPWKRDP